MEQQHWKILVVEDDPVWLNKLAGILEKKGYGVCIAASYEEAMQWLETETFQLAVVDVNLADAPVDERKEPGDTSGMDIIKKIRKRSPEMSVIIVTAFGTPRLAREAFKKLDVFDFIPKDDFKLDEFRSLVASAVSEAVKKTLGEIP